MSLVVSIAVGVVSFFIGLSGGGLGVGLLFGSVMFAMSYGAFVWRPGKKDEPDVAHSHSQAAKANTSTTIEKIQMPQESSARWQAVINSLATPFTKLGMDDAEALSAAKKIIAQMLAEFQPREIDPFKSTQGDEYANRKDFTAPRIEAGLTLDDIRSHWNRPIVIVLGEFKVQEMLNFIYIDVARMQGRDIAQASREYKKTFPRYGDPRKFDPNEKFNHGLRLVDADIFPEFASRLDAWRQSVEEEDVAEAIETNGTLNAAVRAMVSAGEL